MSCEYTIGKQSLEEIKSALGYPVITELDWGTGTDDYIRTKVIPRAIRTYYTYFPVKQDEEYSINGNFSIDYPDDELIFAALRYFFNYKNVGVGVINSNPFLLQANTMYRQGSAYDKPHEVQELFSRMSAIESMIDWHKVTRFEDRPFERKLVGYTNTTGALLVQWAKSNPNFDAIPFHYKENALKLCKGFLLQDAGRLREQAQIQSSKINFNAEVLIAHGDRYVAEVEAEWKGRAHAVVAK